MRALDAQCMDDVAPKQNFLSLGRKFISRYVPGYTRQGDELHAIDDWLGATKRVPLAPEYAAAMLAHSGRTVAHPSVPSSDFWRHQKSLSLHDVNIGVWKDPFSILSAQSADVIGMEVRNQNDVDFFRRVACPAEAARQAPECSPTPPGAGTRIDED